MSRPGAWVLILVLSIGVGACSSDDTYLPALLADPMADYAAEGIVLVDAWEEAEGRDFIMDMPTHAEVVRTYRIVDQSQAEAVLADAVAFAESHGWRLRPSRTSPTTGYGGTKELAPEDGRLGISLGAADPLHDPDGPRILRISLDFGPVRFDDTTTSAP